MLPKRGRECGQCALKPEVLERLGAQLANDAPHLLRAVAGGLRSSSSCSRSSSGIVPDNPSTCSITPVSV